MYHPWPSGISGDGYQGASESRCFLRRTSVPKCTLESVHLCRFELVWSGSTLCPFPEKQANLSSTYSKQAMPPKSSVLLKLTLFLTSYGTLILYRNKPCILWFSWLGFAYIASPCGAKGDFCYVSWTYRYFRHTMTSTFGSNTRGDPDPIPQKMALIDQLPSLFQAGSSHQAT